MDHHRHPLTIPSTVHARLLLVTLVAATLLAGTCDETLNIGPGSIVAVRISPDTAQVRVASTLELQVIPLDASKAFVPGAAATWSSSAPAVASVDTSGVVTGVAAGSAVVTAAVGTLNATAVVLVDIAPEIVFSSDTVTFMTQAGGPDPAPDSVGISNGGGFTLVGLSLGTVTYDDTTVAGWLSATIDSTFAPATVTLTPVTTGITVASTYSARVPVQSTDAGNTPVELFVQLVMAAGAANAAAAAAGDGQSATVGQALPIAPSVSIVDQFGNGVPGVTATFSVVSGGGTLTDSVQTSDSVGSATVGGWTLGGGAGQQRVQATISGLSPVTFTATATSDAADRMSVSAGDNQSAVAAAAVGVPPAVLIADQFGNGVANIAVTFTVASGGGSVTGGNAVSDAAGIAAVGSWTLGAGAGTNTLTATAPGLTGDPITFTALGLPAGGTIALQGGDGQIDTVRATLALVYAVIVTDTNFNGVPGIPVGWAVGLGGGSITPSSTTDAQGIATATRTLGSVAGTQTATASVGGLMGSPVTFTATATAGNAAQIAIDTGNGQTGTVNVPVPTNPSVLVSDQFGNPVMNHSVTFAVTAGSGSVNPMTPVNTDAAGIAAPTSWTLGTMAGTNNNRLQATASGANISGNPITFTASANAGPANSIAAFAGTNQISRIGVAVPTAPAARVLDQFMNPVSGVTVTFSVPGGGGGGSVTSASQQTGANGVATVGSWTLGNANPMSNTGTFANTLNATATVGTASFTASGIYSYALDVHPIWASPPPGGGTTCAQCHGFLNAAATAVHGNIVGQLGSGCASAATRIATGGDLAAETGSLIMQLLDGTAAICLNQMPPGGSLLSAAARNIVRAWVRNGAPNN